MNRSHIIFLVVIIIIVVIVSEIFFIFLNLVAGGCARRVLIETGKGLGRLPFRPLVQLLTFIIPSVKDINRIVKH
jgi:hypothetical protein